MRTRSEALPGILGNRGNRAFISWEQGNKGQILRGTGEQRQYWGTENIRKQIFYFWGIGEQANLFQGNKGTGTPPPPLGRASVVLYCLKWLSGLSEVIYELVRLINNYKHRSEIVRKWQKYTVTYIRGITKF